MTQQPVGDPKGPLEKEIHDLIQHRTLSDPTVHGLAMGTLTAADLARLDRPTTLQVTATVLGAQTAAIYRLAQEIDALRAAADGRDDPPDTG